MAPRAPGFAIGQQEIERLKRGDDALGTYLEHVRWMIDECAKSAHKHRRRAQMILAAIVAATFGAAALSVVSASSDIVVAAIAAAVLSAFAGALSTWARSNRSLEVAAANHRLSMLLDWEYTHFVYRAGPYGPETGASYSRLFVERCEGHTFTLMSEADIFPEAIPSN